MHFGLAKNSLRSLFPRRSVQYIRARRLATADSAVGLQNPGAYCKDLVRKHDYEGFLVSQFWPRELQGGYYALRAFYVELAMVQDNVTNPTIAKMRMQFWRDAVKDITNDRPPRHPIALALHEASQKSNLPVYHLKRIIDARDAELHTPVHLTTESLISHAESTSSTFFYLLLSLLSLSNSSTLSHAASHLGVAQTISTLLRALPYHAQQGRMVIPAEITAKHGVKQEEVFRKGPGAEGIEDAVFEFATLGNDHLLTARSIFEEKKVPMSAMPVFLAGIPISRWFERLERAKFDAFSSEVVQRDWRLAWRMWRGYYNARF
ncbi:hypothetical protein BDN72DRAFT_774321 [Pluteus cervinus]|uniref:Uncharacterized protein n=1 Tax=Pluteus cervinus TaxID=181527 RepID=A0ACD3AGX3_9AGAR|nr:hypothetical protein BDN72DRAFT_774321 [Pluteus cervinus]